MRWLTCCQCKSKEEKVTEIDFSRCGIAEIPAEVYANSPTLEVLHLEGNKLKDLSPQLFQCIDLRYLNVSDNEIRSIPPLISKLTNLQVLIFSKNILDGVHPNLDKLNKLTMLDLSMNDLGKVPEAITTLINLQQLCLNDTGIDYIPANIGRLSNLRVLELRDNNLCELPKSVRRLTNLQRLDVSDNNLLNLTQVCESHGNLTELWINGNNISELSLSITHLKKINDFDASCNNLESIPKEIGHWTKITNLILSFNNLVSLPNAIGNLRNLQVLKLESNFIEELPTTLCKLVNLEELNLQNNSLIKLPSSIGHLRKLATLILSDNKLQQLPPEIGSCQQLSILNVHHNQLERLPDEIGHLQNLTTLGLIGNKLSFLPLTISKLRNLKALWLTPNQTQPLIHLQNEQLFDGQMVLTSIVFPQAPYHENPLNLQTPQTPQTYHISFNTERSEPDPDITNAHVSLSRTPTPHYKELKRLKEVLRKNQVPRRHADNILSNVKEAKVTSITGDFNNSQQSLNCLEIDTAESVSDDITQESSKIPLKQPPPYHIAAAYSKNAHLFANTFSPPSPYDQPKQFSQQQPVNIHMPTPKLPTNRNHLLQMENISNENDPEYLFYDSEFKGNTSGAEDFPAKLQKWPFGKHQICQVIEVELPEQFQSDDFQISVQNDGLFVKYVNNQSEISRKLFIGDKILAFDDIDYTVVDPMNAYQDAIKRLHIVRIITVSRKQPS